MNPEVLEALRQATKRKKASSLMEVLPNVEAPDTKKAIDDYRIAWSLLRSTILLANVEAIDAEGRAFQIYNS